MTTNVSQMFKFRDAVSGNGKLLIAVAIVIFAILPVNAQISIGEAKQQMKNAEAAGLRLVQHGVYGDGSGEYNYLDAPELHCIVELLESYGK